MFEKEPQPSTRNVIKCKRNAIKDFNWAPQPAFINFITKVNPPPTIVNPYLGSIIDKD